MWEAVTAISTLGTGVAIVLTVLLGIRQLRLTSAHLAHLRRATQLEGAMKIFDDIFSPPFREAMRFVLSDLSERMHDPSFKDETAHVGMADDKVHKELTVMRSFERIGTYVKNGLIDGPIIYDLVLPVIVSTWEALAEIVRIHRASYGQGLWERYEFLYRDGNQWYERTRGAHYMISQPSSGTPENDAVTVTEVPEVVFRRQP